MTSYETLTRKELLQRFKPIEIKTQPWPFSSTMVLKITERETTRTGKVQYAVLFKDGQTGKVSAQSLNESNKQLVEDFELNLFRLRERPPRRTSTRVVSAGSTNNTSTASSRESTPIKRKNNFQIKYTNRKKIRYEPKGRPGNDLKNSVVNISDDEVEEDEDSGESSEQATRSTTRSGRQTARERTWQEEFVRERAARGIERYQYTVPLYTDRGFINSHSLHCNRCYLTGSIHGPTQVVVGTEIPRTRLLLCKVCSNSTHNNCLPNHAQQHFDIETGEYTCAKCIKKNTCACIECKKALKASPTSAALRCILCYRAFHKKCIKKGVSTDLVDVMNNTDIDKMYQSGQCLECITHGQTSGKIVAERIVKEGRKEYMLKWQNQSFRHTSWVAESWVVATQSINYRSYTGKIERNILTPKSGIPIEWTIVDRILNVEWADKENQVVKRILAVFKDRDYSEVIWDDPPTEQETELYPDYKIALDRYIKGTKVKPPVGVRKLIKEVRERAQAENYEKHELKAQPGYINGGKLMKHQMEALNWLLYQWENKQSCILADDMGLGKTIQIISYFYVLYKKYHIYPFICVVPNSTATNWIREFEKWAPELAVAPFFGSNISRKLALDNEVFRPNGGLKCHVVVCTYESAMESTMLHRTPWSVVVVDESQRLKNDESMLFKTLKTWDVDQITLLTGTPLQNNLRELFNIMNFIQPKGFHGDEAENYIDMTTANVEELHGRLRPHFLRRTKEEVLKTLPPKYELIVPLSMTPLQKRVYKECLSGEIHETLNAATGAKRQRGLSSIFMNLRKTLNHPYLLDGVETMQPTLADTQAAMIGAAGKLKLFHQMYPKLKAQGHRMLIFSTMTRVLDILEDYLTYEKIGYTRLDGTSSERDRVRSIDAFNDPNSKLDVFLLSTRAGGVGINLATADTIIIWDSDFNPYADLQAISRAHRIGQQNMVLILRLMTRLSIEEKVLQIGKKKMALEHVVVERMTKENDEEKLEDIESILKYGAEALFADDDSKDVQYDSAAIDSLLDREKYRETAIEKQQEEIKEAEEGNKKAAEQGMNFSFAKVWKADGSIEDLPSEDEVANNNDEDFWEKFLKEKEIEAARKKEERRLAVEQLGRGARKRAVVTYRENYKAAKKDTKNERSDEEFEPEVVVDVEEEFDELTQEELQKRVLKLKVNGPKPPPAPTGSENVQIIMHDPSSANNQQVVLRQPQQQPIHPCFTIAYEEEFYKNMLMTAAPYTQRIRNIHTRAFNEGRHQNAEFASVANAMFRELFVTLNNHYRQQFNNEYARLEADGTPLDQLDSIYKQQTEVLTRHFGRLGKFLDAEIHRTLQQLQQAKQEETERLQREQMERLRVLQEREQVQQLARQRAQEEARQAQMQALRPPQQQIQFHPSQQQVQLQPQGQAVFQPQQQAQYEAQLNNQLQAQAQWQAQRQQQAVEAQRQQQIARQRQQQQRQAQIPLQLPAIQPAPRSLQIAGNLDSNLLGPLQSIFDQVRGQGQGQAISTTEILEQISRLTAQAAEEERRKEGEEKRRREQQEAQGKFRLEAAGRARLQQQSSPIAQSSSTSTSPIIINYTPNQQQQQQQAYGTYSTSPPQGFVDAPQLELNNTTYNQSISPQMQRFNSPPNQPGATTFNSSTPTPPSTVPAQPLPNDDETNRKIGDAILNMFKGGLGNI